MLRPYLRRPMDWFPTDRTSTLLWLWLLHAGLALAMHRVTAVATLHASVTTVVALAVALMGRQSVHVAYITAYIVGAEVLWRMSHASVFYETGKYVVAAVCLIAVCRMGRKHIPAGALLYFILLLPGLIEPFVVWGFKPFIRNNYSFNMSGPLAMLAAMCFFANVKMTRAEIWRMLLILATPVVGVASITMFSTYTAEQIAFSTQSNKLTSGGFGPNQVANALGLGALVMLLYLAQEPLEKRRKALVSVALLMFLMQSALTFSRGGIYAAFGAFVPALFFLLADPRVRSRLASMILVLGALAVLVLVPFLMHFTGGAISDRFSSTHMTGRETIMATDLQLWAKNPLYGIGVGMSADFHQRGLVAHSEFTRLLAEHGVFGLGALVSLLLTVGSCFFSLRGLHEKAFVSAMCAWSLLFMSANGFRIAAPAFALGLACMKLDLETEPARLASVRLPRWRLRLRQQQPTV